MEASHAIVLLAAADGVANGAESPHLQLAQRCPAYLHVARGLVVHAALDDQRKVHAVPLHRRRRAHLRVLWVVKLL